MIAMSNTPATARYFQSLIFITSIFLIAICLLSSTTILSAPKVYSFDEDRKLFAIPVTDVERAIFVNLIKTFQRVVPNNLTYFLYGGSLLGSFRHHDMIPWDDDLDLCVRQKDKDILLKTLRAIEPEYKVTTRCSTLWKFYHNSSKPTRTRWGAWPFIDIFFYAENSTHIWDSNPTYKRYKHKKTDVFPLVPRLFMNMLLPTPKNTSFFLRKFFNVDLCVSNSWSHKFQMETKRVASIPCLWLENDFQFVHNEMQTKQLLGYRTVV